MMMLIPCPKCDAHALNVAIDVREVIGKCPGCDFSTGWVPVPRGRQRHGYLRTRCRAVAVAYRRVRGAVGVSC